MQSIARLAGSEVVDRPPDDLQTLGRSIVYDLQPTPESEVETESQGAVEIESLIRDIASNLEERLAHLRVGESIKLAIET